MKNLSLSYSLPSSLLRKTNFFSMVRIYGQAQNLFTITGFNGLDPEVSSNIYQAQYIRHHASLLWVLNCNSNQERRKK